MKKFKSVCKLKILFTAAIFIAAIALAGCKKDDPVKVSGVSLNKTTLTLTVGERERLKPSYTENKATLYLAGGRERPSAMAAPDNTRKKAAIWSSSDYAVATVDQNGRIIAVKAGTATITVTTANGKAACSVTVKAANEGEMYILPAGNSEDVID